MYQNDAEILFPMRVAPQLRDLRGEVWRRLVDTAMYAADGSVDHLAFTLLLVRLSSCLTCHPDSYRAMRGCTACAIQTIRRYRGEDQELQTMFNQAYAEVGDYINQSSPVSHQDATVGDIL